MFERSFYKVLNDQSGILNILVITIKINVLKRWENKENNLIWTTYLILQEFYCQFEL